MPNPNKEKKHQHQQKANLSKPKFTGVPIWATPPSADKRTEKGKAADAASTNVMSPLASPFSPRPQSSTSAPALASPALELHRDVEKLTGEEMFESVKTLDDEGLKQAMAVPPEYFHTPGYEPTEFSLDAPSSVIGKEMADMIPKEKLLGVTCQAMGALGAMAVVTKGWQEKLSDETSSQRLEKQAWTEAEREPSETTLTDFQEEEEYYLQENFGDKVLRHKLPRDQYTRGSLETVVTAVCSWLGMSANRKDIVVTEEYIAMRKHTLPTLDPYEEAKRITSLYKQKASRSPPEYYKGGTDVETPASTGGSEEDTRSEEARSYKEKPKKSRPVTPPPVVLPHHKSMGPLKVELHGHYAETESILLELPFPKYFDQIRAQNLSPADAVEYILVQEDKFDQYSTTYNLATMKVHPNNYYKIVDLVSQNEQ